MSAPTTHSKISENPGKMGVTVAASGKELEADVQRKMKLWGVVEAFNAGKMPDNKQIDKALDFAIGHSPVALNQLSAEGRVLIDDTRDILETLRMMVQEKNADELFQNALYTSFAGDASRAKQDGVIPISKNDAQKDADQAAAHLRTLVTLFITNSEARKLLNDLGLIGRDVFATAASKAADKARPDQERLDQVDQEAPSKQWIGPDGQKLGTNDTPELQLKGPGGSEVRYNPKDAPGNAKVTDNQGNTRSAAQAKNEAMEKKEELRQAKDEHRGEAQGTFQQATETAKSHAQDVASSRDPNASFSEQKDQMAGRANQKANEEQSRHGNVDRDEAEQQARGKAQQLKEKIPEEHRERISNTINETKDFLDEQFPEERREQFIYRLKKVVVECQEHSDYQEAMSWLLDTFENYKGAAEHVTNKGANAAGQLASDPAVASSTNQFRTLLERFANGKSMQGMQDALDQIYRDVQNDDGLRNWFSRFNDFMHRALLEPGYILEDDSDREARKIWEDGKSFFTEKYKGHQQTLFDEIQLWFTAMHHDPLNRRLGDDVKRLTKDLLFNSEGNLTFKPHLWSDLRHAFLPSIIKQIGYVPIPRAEYSDDQIDLVIENLILSGPNLFPNVVELEAHNQFKFSPYEGINKTMDVHHHRLRLGLSQIQADIRDVSFAFRRKKGWPKISDRGLADVVIAGKGISVEVDIETVHNRRDSVFRVRNVKTQVDTLTFSIRDSKHNLLYKFIRATATGVIKKAIAAAVSTAIRTALGHLDDQLTEIRNNVEEAKKSDDATRTQALKDLYARKKETAKANAEEAKHNAEEQPGKFKIVANRDSMINADMGHSTEKSTLARVWKTEDLAHSGREWHSPAFDLLDKQHPAVTGKNHPEAVKGAAAGHSLTSQMQEGTGKLDRLKAEHGKTEGERIAHETGQVHGAANTGTQGVRAPMLDQDSHSHSHSQSHSQSNTTSGLPTSGLASSTHAQQYAAPTGSYPAGATGATGVPTGSHLHSAISGLPSQSSGAGAFDPATGTYSSAPAPTSVPGYQAGSQGRAL